MAFALLLALAAPAPARASQVVAPGTPPVGPVLAGPEVVWGEWTPDSGIAIRAAIPGGAPRLVHTIPRGGTVEQFELFASATHLGWHDYATHPCGKGGDCPSFSEIWAGPLNGPYERIARCEAAPYPSAPRLSGNTLVYVGAGCSASEASQVVVRELRDGDDALRTIRVADGYVTDLSIDGRFVAYTLNAPPAPVTHVFDTASGTDAYTLPFGARSDVQADGKLGFVRPARTRPDDGPLRLGFATPAEPRDHALPVVQSGAGRVTYPLETAGDRIAFARPREGCDISEPELELAVTDLSGNQGLLTELRGHRAPLGRKPFDFDGRRVTWLGVSGSGPAVMFRDIAAEPPAATANGPECPIPRASDVVIRAGRVRADRLGRAPVRVSCRPARDAVAVPCRGRLELRRAGRETLLGSARFRIGARRSAVVRVRLRRAARGLLRELGSVHVDALAVARAPATNGFTSLRLLASRRRG